VAPAPVEALFYNFHPSVIRRALPDAWQLAPPEALVQARLHAIDGALWRLFGEDLRSAELAAVALIAREAAEAADCSGRPLAAAHQALDWPTVPHLVLWHAATVLREHRGDGHVATLVHEGLSGLQAHVLAVAARQTEAALQRQNRRWSEDDWADAVDQLRRRGALDRDGELTRRGRALKDRVEAHTDELAVPAYRSLPSDDVGRLEQVVSSLARRVAAAGAVPFPNPMALPPPPDADEPPPSPSPSP
jgi:hypothetical protein